MSLTPKDKIEYRQLANRDILARISDVIDRYPDMRFMQILWNMDIITREPPDRIEDRYYEESVDTLDKLRQL